MDRYCEACGRLLVKRDTEKSWKFKTRITCGKGTDCPRDVAAKNKKKNINGGLNAKPMDEDDIAYYNDPLDIEQMQINLAIIRKDAAAKGYGHSPVVTITGKDAARMLAEGKITHIDNIRTQGGKHSWRG